MKSKTQIDRQAQRKGNSELVETIIAAKKNSAWLKIAGVLAYPRRQKVEINLDIIEGKSKEGDTIIVPGKILGKGNISKKVVVIALGFSEEAMKKLKEKKCETRKILEEINKNPKAQGIKVIM